MSNHVNPVKMIHRIYMIYQDFFWTIELSNNESGAKRILRVEVELIAPDD
jgi:hypothetical protein